MSSIAHSNEGPMVTGKFSASVELGELFILALPNDAAEGGVAKTGASTGIVFTK